MKKRMLADIAKEHCSGKIFENISMKLYTTMHVGGFAQIVAVPAGFEDVCKLVQLAGQEKLPWYIIGCGSNLIIKDGGIEGMVILLSDPVFCKMHVSGNIVRVGGGLFLWKLIDNMRDRGLSGLELLSGIPGTVGGCIRMNAGANGKTIDETLLTVKCVNSKGELEVLDQKAISFDYRSAQGLVDKIIIEAEFACAHSDTGNISQTISICRLKRRKSQPGGLSAGCIFKNSEGLSAGSLIELAGMKGIEYGGAKVSERHSNFIINRGDAKASDIIKLMEKVQEGVWNKLKVKLEPEVLIIGRD
ncbi:MAG: UDP-N-acetylmuramate dehydrogenase [Candidatus Theseobacter exili]|nr:UDP-N-acetylmuramate dehydrogenase [Candidatus Theseobacter exili]